MIVASRGAPRAIVQVAEADVSREAWTYPAARCGLVIPQLVDGVLADWGLTHPDGPACEIEQRDRWPTAKRCPTAF